MMTARDMRASAMTVLRVRGMPRMGTLSTAVITSSRAEANAFRIELSFLRKRLVTMPSTELLMISSRTSGLLIDSKDDRVKAVQMSPYRNVDIKCRLCYKCYLG